MGACSHTVKKNKDENIWHMVYRPMKLKQVLISEKINSSYYLKSLRYRFPLLKYPKKWTGPDQLSKYLNDAGYKSQIINKNMVVNSPPDYIASAWYTIRKISNGERVSKFTVTARCVKYQTPDMSPPSFWDDCFISRSSLARAGLYLTK